MADVSGAVLEAVLLENVSIETTIHSDSSYSYRGLKEVEYRFNHRELELREYANHLLSEVLLAQDLVHELQNALEY